MSIKIVINDEWPKADKLKVCMWSDGRQWWLPLVACSEWVSEGASCFPRGGLFTCLVFLVICLSFVLFSEILPCMNLPLPLVLCLLSHYSCSFVFCLFLSVCPLNFFSCLSVFLFSSIRRCSIFFIFLSVFFFYSIAHVFFIFSLCFCLCICLVCCVCFSVFSLQPFVLVSFFLRSAFGLFIPVFMHCFFLPFFSF